MRPGPLAILVPVLRRPHRVVPVLDSAMSNTPEPWRVLFIASPGDEAEFAALTAAGARPPQRWHRGRPRVVEVIEVEGNYARKINQGIVATDEPLIFTGADDLDFRPGWLAAAFDRAQETGAEVIGTQDLTNPRVIAGLHATHFLVSRAYVEEHGTIDEPGKLYHESYPHEFVDDELIGTAKHRGLYAFADRSVVEHLHPLAGKAPVDELYAGAGERMRIGRNIYRRRRHLWQGGEHEADRRDAHPQ